MNIKAYVKCASSKSAYFFQYLPYLVLLILMIYNISSVHGQVATGRSDLEQKSLIASKWLEPIQITSNQEKYDVFYYLIDYDFNVVSNIASPIAMVEIRLIVSNGPISEVDLDFAHYYTIDSIKVNMVTSGFSHENSIITVELDRAYENQENISIIVYYHGESWPLGNDYDGKPMFWTIFEPYGARTVFPCKDTPSDKADSVDIKFTVPENMIAVSNGLLFSETNQGGNTTYWWKTRYPIATYLVFIAAYEYVHYQDWYVSVTGDSMPIDFYVVPDHFANSQTNFYETKNMISIFANLFGEYPFIDEKYGHAEILTGTSMEHQTCTSLGMYASNNGDYSLWLIAHELAHHWWGDMITCASFHHIWLNEGFATYSVALYFESTGGEEAYKTEMTSNEYHGAGTIYVEDPENENIFDWDLSYRKAGYVVHMLRHVVGDSVFFSILNAYADDIRYQYKSAKTEEFQAICEQISGMSLQKFFQQWIYEEYYPHYAYGWNIKPMELRYQIKLGIEQIQENTVLFWMPIDVRITTSSYDTVFVVWDSLQSQTFEFFVNGEPINVEIDPNNWILKKSSIKMLAPHAENIILNRPYQAPGTDTLIVTSETANPENHNLELEAFIESIDGSIYETIPMNDDGLHVDSTAGDGIFSAVWPVPSGESYYDIHIKTLSFETGYYNILQNAGFFTTIGPVVFNEYTITSADTIPNPGDRFSVAISLINESAVDTVFNITAKMTSMDSCALVMAFDRIYDNIAPGEVAQPNRSVLIQFEENCPEKTFVDFALDIFSDGNLFWSDTFTVFVDSIVSSIEKIESMIPSEYALKQNFPNPFNPITTIDYQLLFDSNVELSIYNILGQKITTLVSERKSAGTHQTEWDATGFTSGIYYYRIEAGEFQDVKKMILLR